MTDEHARREAEWRTALAELVEFYESQRSQDRVDSERLRHEMDGLARSLEARTAERDAAHARIAELAARIAELEKPFLHVVKAVGRRIRPRRS